MAQKQYSPTRVLFFGDSAPSGFGTVTRNLGAGLLDLGLDVRFISQNELGDALPERFKPRTVDAMSLRNVHNILSGEQGAVPSDIVGDLVRGTTPATMVDGSAWGAWKPQAVLLLGDYMATRILVAQAHEAFAAVPTFHYIPIEGVDLPPAWGEMWEFIHPVAMSKFGAAEIGKVTGTDPPVIYHGVNTDEFHPISPRTPLVMSNGTDKDVKLRTRAECKAMWATYFGAGKDRPIPITWALRTDRHMPRKRYTSLFRAMLPVLVHRPDVALVIHCRIYDQGGNLEDTISKIPGARQLLPDKEGGPRGYAILDRSHPQILLTNAPGMGLEALVSLYNAADLYVTVSAEGFGLTIAEAAACGTAVLAMDYSSVPEVVGPAGRLVPVAGLIDNEYDHAWAAVDEPAFARAAEYLLTHQARREELGRRGPRHVAQSFSWRTAAEQFAALISGAVEG